MEERPGPAGAPEVPARHHPAGIDGVHAFDIGPLSYVVTPQKRWMGNAFAHYDFSERATGYLEMHYSSNVAQVQIGPEFRRGVAQILLLAPGAGLAPWAWPWWCTPCSLPR